MSGSATSGPVSRRRTLCEPVELSARDRPEERDPFRTFQKRRERLFLSDPVVGAEEGDVVERWSGRGYPGRFTDGDSSDDGGVDMTLLMLQGTANRKLV